MVRTEQQALNLVVEPRDRLQCSLDRAVSRHAAAREHAVSAPRLIAPRSSLRLSIVLDERLVIIRVCLDRCPAWAGRSSVTACGWSWVRSSVYWMGFGSAPTADGSFDPSSTIGPPVNHRADGARYQQRQGNMDHEEYDDRRHAEKMSEASALEAEA